MLLLAFPQSLMILQLALMVACLLVSIATSTSSRMRIVAIVTLRAEIIHSECHRSDLVAVPFWSGTQPYYEIEQRTHRHEMFNIPEDLR